MSESERSSFEIFRKTLEHTPEGVAWIGYVSSRLKIVPPGRPAYFRAWELQLLIRRVEFEPDPNNNKPKFYQDLLIER